MKVLRGSILSAAKVKKLAKEVGLDCIDYEAYYRIVKTSSKKDNNSKKAERTEVYDAGLIQLCGQQSSVWIVTVGKFDWFKTSPVVNCYKLNSNNIRIETSNSFYTLEPL